MIEERFRATLSLMFGSAALVLAAVGLYGLAARRVADRRREIGVRVALGARPVDIRRLVIGDAVRTIAVGRSLGFPVAYVASRVTGTLLYGVSPTAPHVFATAAAVLAVSAFAATLLPAPRRRDRSISGVEGVNQLMRYPSRLGSRFLLLLSLTPAVLAQRPTPPNPTPGAGEPRTASEQSKKVDELFRRWHAPDSPGAAVLVIHDGRIVHAKGYGMANLEHGVPIRPDTVFDIASVSKQFAAMAVALLEADGRISLDDDVRRHVREVPDFGRTITLRHLVHHTSGIRDWPGTLSMAGWNFQDVVSFNQILRMAYHQRELNFEPGDQHSYSNTGYNLLAEVVARVSGKSFREFCEDRIFRPLAMTDTHFQDDHTEVVPNSAHSYRPGGDGRVRHVVSSLTALGSSSLFTTVNDLAKWIDNYHSQTPKVGTRAIIARLHERGRLNSGASIAYAFGQSLGEYRGLQTVSHTGSWAGYRSVLERFPDQRFAVAILANTADMNPFQLARQIDDIYLADRFTQPASAAPAAAAQAGRGGAPAGTWRPSAAELQSYAGEYRSGELLTSYELVVRDGQLIARHFRTGDHVLNPVESDRFQAGVFGDVRFVRGAGNAVTSFTANSERVRRFRFERVAR